MIEQRSSLVDVPHRPPSGRKAVKARCEESEMCSCAALETKPLQLLDLPIDTLKEIVREVTHTNDLTALALTHPILNALAVPCIYSQFDIIWPDVSLSNRTQTGVDVSLSNRTQTGVDALSYGLSTLVMSRDVFETNDSEWRHGNSPACSNCGHIHKSNITSSSDKRKRRRGNNYAQYTRKFSLGNGPPKVVRKYLISKKSGKMLGTLVALAVARMMNLESFTWDMPTGIVGEVWDALSFLGDREDDKPSRLERIWVRCHDSKRTLASENDGLSPQSHSASTQGDSDDGRGFLDVSYQHIVHPNFSILSPMKSISVLNIDELAYLEELSVLVESSVECLRELRVGSAKMWHAKDWPSASKKTLQVDTDPIRGYASADGILGIAMRRLYDHRRRTSPITDAISENISPKQLAIGSNLNKNDHHDVDTPNNLEKPKNCTELCQSSTPLDISATLPETLKAVHHDDYPILVASGQGDDLNLIDVPHSQETSVDLLLHQTARVSRPQENGHVEAMSKPNTQQASVQSNDARNINGTQDHDQRKVLRLRVLELEQISLGLDVLKKTIDWTVLTSLTLLGCESDEGLWKALRRIYSPRPDISADCSSRKGPALLEYRLNLKRVQTNNVSPSLIAFLKETLAPNTLECLILQDNHSSASKMSIETIFRGPIRRHRASLRKLMIDGEGSKPKDYRSDCWKKWTFTRESITFATSQMPALKELGMAGDYKDWHFFLQQLPNVPHLRSLYIPYMNDHVHRRNMDPRELALQILVTVSLRPELELCYVGIFKKCFEILETNSGDQGSSKTESQSAFSSSWMPHLNGESDSEDDSTHDHFDDDDNDHDDSDEANDTTAQVAYWEDGDSLNDSDAELSHVNGNGEKTRLKIREILFFTEKVEIFKARNGTL